jgi:hypothetical protein
LTHKSRSAWMLRNLGCQFEHYLFYVFLLMMVFWCVLCGNQVWDLLLGSIYACTVIQAVHLVCETNETTFEEFQICLKSGHWQQGTGQGTGIRDEKSGVGKYLRTARTESWACICMCVGAHVAGLYSHASARIVHLRTAGSSCAGFCTHGELSVYMRV